MILSPHFQRISHDPCINANELAAQASMIFDRSGSSIKGELIACMDNASALFWVNLGRARNGDADRLQVGVFYWLAIRKIRNPFFLRAGRHFSIYSPTRAIDAHLRDRGETHAVARIRLCRKWGGFETLSTSMRRYREIRSRPVVYYPHLLDVRVVFVEFSPIPFSFLHFVTEMGIRNGRIDPFRSYFGSLAAAECCVGFSGGPFLFYLLFRRPLLSS